MHADAGHRQRLSLASGSALPGQGTIIVREWRDFRPRSVGGAAGELALFPYLLYVASGHSAACLTDDWGAYLSTMQRTGRAIVLVPLNLYELAITPVG